MVRQQRNCFGSPLIPPGQFQGKLTYLFMPDIIQGIKCCIFQHFLPCAGILDQRFRRQRERAARSEDIEKLCPFQGILLCKISLRQNRERFRISRSSDPCMCPEAQAPELPAGISGLLFSLLFLLKPFQYLFRCPRSGRSPASSFPEFIIPRQLTVKVPFYRRGALSSGGGRMV